MTREEWNAALTQRHGSALQQRLSQTKVAVCGLGGLGSNISIYLARAGVGTLCLIDCDRVDITNLHRQQYVPDQLGQCKTDALAETLHRINPYCTLITQTVRLTEENIPTLLHGFPVICEAFDRADQKAMLVNTVLTQLPEAYLVAASGMAGLGSPNTIRTRRPLPHLYLCGDESSDVETEGTLFSARVAVCAAHQSTTVLRIIAGDYEV